MLPAHLWSTDQTQLDFTALVFLVLHGLGLPNVIFLIVLGILNWLLLLGFVWLVNRVAVATAQLAALAEDIMGRPNVNRAQTTATGSRGRDC